MALELYHTLFSTCSQKVRVCLFEKDLPWIDHHVDFFKNEHLTPEYMKLNPNGVVPTLVHDGRPIIESSVICEYLDEVFAENPLSSCDPYERARLRAWLCFINEVPTAYIRYTTFNIAMRGPVENMSEEERLDNANKRGARKFLYRMATRDGINDAEMMNSLDALRDTVNKVNGALAGGNWIMGDYFSLAEANIIPSFDRMEDMSMGDMWADKPRVVDWWNRIKARPAFIKAYPPGSRASEVHPDTAESSRLEMKALLERTGRFSMAEATAP